MGAAAAAAAVLLLGVSPAAEGRRWQQLQPRLCTRQRRARYAVVCGSILRVRKPDNATISLDGDFDVARSRVRPEVRPRREFRRR
jgi:hypothetical protein